MHQPDGSVIRNRGSARVRARNREGVTERAGDPEVQFGACAQVQGVIRGKPAYGERSVEVYFSVAPDGRRVVVEITGEPEIRGKVRISEPIGGGTVPVRRRSPRRKGSAGRRPRTILLELPGFQCRSHPQKSRTQTHNTPNSYAHIGLTSHRIPEKVLGI